MSLTDSEIIIPAAAPTDSLLPFQIEALDVRGRVVRLGPVLNEVLAAHQYPLTVAQLLAEALSLTALLGSVLRDGGAQVTIQARSDGPLRLLVTDYLVSDQGVGQIRGYAEFDFDKVAALPPAPRLEQLCGVGHLALTIDQPGENDRYQGIVPLEGVDLSAATQAYFEASEQLPTVCKLAAQCDEHTGAWTAGGLLVQHLARSEAGGERLFASDAHPKWQHAKALASTIKAAELCDQSLALTDLVWRLFHQDEPRIFPALAITKGCRCTRERIQGVLRQFSFEELMDMREPDGSFKLNCAFCSRDWIIERPEENT